MGVNDDKPYVRAVRPLLVGLFVVLATAGCVQETPTSLDEGVSDVSLADTKSPVQLLRNEVAARIPADLLERVESTQDRSLACKEQSDDPDGLIRSWHSSLRATLLSESSDGVDALVSDLVKTFTDQNWSAQPVSRTEVSDAILLTSPDSIASIEIEAGQDSGNTAVIRVDTYGPCVVTDGKNSEEVKALEGS